jgi:hypothetical protein
MQLTFTACSPLPLPPLNHLKFKPLQRSLRLEAAPASASGRPWAAAHSSCQGSQLPESAVWQPPLEQHAQQKAPGARQQGRRAQRRRRQQTPRLMLLLCLLLWRPRRRGRGVQQGMVAQHAGAAGAHFHAVRCVKQPQRAILQGSSQHGAAACTG